MTMRNSARRGRLNCGSALACLLAASGIAAVALPTAAFAQVAGDAPAPAETTTAAQSSAPATPAGVQVAQSDDAETIIVTGTVFRRTNTETPSPVTVLTQERLAAAGINNIADAIRSISADSSGSIPTSFTGGFAGGSAAVSLRGLSVNSTLVLIDGLRTANYPLDDDGQRAFVDLNSIPQSITERVEVLKDGASSSYGADAIGGVVNVILRKQIIGVEGTVEAGLSKYNDGGTQRVTLTAGTGDLAKQGFNVYINGEYQHDSQILANRRPFPFNTADLTSIGGTNDNAGAVGPGATTSAVVRPATYGTPGDILSGVADSTRPYQILNPAGCASGGIAHFNPPTVETDTTAASAGGSYCEQNGAGQYGAIQPRQDRYGVTVHGTFQVSDDIQAYATGTYYQSKVSSLGFPSTIRSANPINTQSIALPATLANGQLNPNNPYAAEGLAALLYYRFGDIPSSSSTNSHVLRGSAGINGAFGDGWTFSADLTAAHSWLDINTHGAINLAALTEAVTTGSYNFVDPSQNSAAVRAALSPDLSTSATTDLDMIQGVVTKELFQLPGGALQLGVGGSLRYEKQNDPNQNPNLTTLGINQFSAIGDRTVASAYFEVNAPIVKQLEVSVSGRYDHYSEGYSNFSPKVGAKFTPIPQVAVRGTFSKGFRAPSFAEGSNGSVIGFTTTAPPADVIAEHGNNAYVQNYSIGFATVSNPDIKPEKSRSFTGGVVFQPVRWLSVTADYYNIKKTRVITGGPLAGTAIDAYYAGEALPDGYSITQDTADPDFPTATRRILLVNSPFVNAAALKTSGIDISATATIPLGDTAKLTSTFEGTGILKYDFQPGDGTTLHYVGTQAPYILSSGAGTPKYRANWQNTVAAGPATLSATVYYTSGYKSVAEDQNGAGATSCDDALYSPDFCRTKSFVQVDLVGSLKVSDSFTFYANVLNVANRKPPLNPANYAALNYNPTWSQQGIVGRFYRVGANFKF